MAPSFSILEYAALSCNLLCFYQTFLETVKLGPLLEPLEDLSQDIFGTTLQDPFVTPLGPSPFETMLVDLLIRGGRSALVDQMLSLKIT